MAEACKLSYYCIKSSFSRIVSEKTFENLFKKTDPYQYESMIKDGDYFNIVYGIRRSISIPFYLVYT